MIMVGTLVGLVPFVEGLESFIHVAHKAFDSNEDIRIEYFRSKLPWKV